MRRFGGGAVALALALGALGAISACTLLTDLDALSGGAEPLSEAGAEGGAPLADSAASSDAPLVDADAGRNDAEAGCKGIHGPKPVSVGSYCIDSTEVTGTQYSEFLAAKAGDAGGQPDECSWNTSYDPSIASDGLFPVFGTDWCDALAYCTWAGKRLCGKLGGGSLPESLVNNAFADEWFRACSHDGANTFPYGNTHDPNACNGYDRDGGGGPVPVASLAGCEGGYAGVFDLSGNLWEWEDACKSDGGAATGCLIHGSSFASQDNTACSAENYVRRDRGGQNDITIRCCSDLE